MIKNEIFRPFGDILSSPCMKTRAICNDFFPPFLAARFSCYFASALITVHLTPREKPTKTEAPKRRHGNEDRFTAHDARGWTSGKKVGQTAQLPLGTCSALLPERFSRISRHLSLSLSLSLSPRLSADVNLDCQRQFYPAREIRAYDVSSDSTNAKWRCMTA
jgi:hypothetical protein